MAISASSIASSSTLNELRTQFNNLVTDVTAIEGGAISYTTLNTTTTNATTLNVKEDGTIVFEGATDDGFETTLTVVDPTADRTITFPNTSGTVVVSGDGGFTVADGGTIGSTSTTDAMTISSTGIVTFKDDIILKDAATIGVTSSTSAISIASTGIVTFVDDILIKDGGTIGSASSTSAISIASTGIVTFVDDILIKDGGTIGSASAAGAITISSGGIVTLVDDLIIKDGGTIGSASDVDAITIAADGDTTFSQDVIITGDLTVSGDDITMGTNTASNLLVADGTNFNSVAISSFSEISTVANDDVFLAIDTSGGGLKKIARSAVVAGLATSSAISNVVEDTSPQLGGNLDMNGADIVTTSNATLDLAPNGTGTVVIRGNNNSGTIVFNCEDNSHGQTLKAQPHSVGATNTMLLPEGANSTLVSLVSTDTLTNKTLTSPVINTGTFGTSILPTSADGTTLGSASKEFSDLFLADASTIQFGNDQEVILTHVPDVGLKLSHEATGDNLPIVLNLESEEDDIASGEEIGRIDFTAGDSGGTDAITTAASIAAVAEDTFASDNNSTGLAFKLGVSAAATEMFRMDHNGDFKVLTDGSAIAFGANNEIELTHVHNTGLLLTDSGGTPTLQFHDANESFSSDGSKIIMISGGTTFNMPTSDGTDGQALATDGSGTLSFVSVAANTPSSADGQALGSASLEWSDLFLADAGTIQFGNDQEIRLTHVADVGLTLSHTASGDDKPVVLNLKSEEDELASGEEIGRIDFTAGDSGGTDAITTAASIAAVAEDAFASDNNSTGLAFKLGVSAAATEMFRMDHDGDFKVLTDGSAIAFGANNEIELTHVHNTGLLLTDSGGSPTLQLHDANESVMSDGTNLKLTSGGTAYTIPTSDGSNGQFLKTNGSGVLSFGTVTTTGAFVVYEYTATAAQTSFSGNDDNSSSLSYTAGVNNVLVSVNGVLLDGSDYTATNGTAVVLSAAAAANDMIKIQATNSSSITSTDLNGSELVLDADGDTTLAADTDDTIDIKIAGADDFRFTANTLTALSGSSIVVPDGGLTFGSTAISSTAAELNKLDGATVTTAEINIIDGNTSATSTTVADADRVVLNDNGTMVQVAMTDIKTYIGGGTSWQAVKTGDFTAAAGQGVFCDTSSAAFTLTLPASPSIGDEVAFKDYAKTFDTNNLTIARNSSKIEGDTNDLTVDVEGAGNTLVFTDSTQGWLLRNK